MSIVIPISRAKVFWRLVRLLKKIRKEYPSDLWDEIFTLLVEMRLAPMP